VQRTSHAGGLGALPTRDRSAGEFHGRGCRPILARVDEPTIFTQAGGPGHCSTSTYSGSRPADRPDPRGFRLAQVEGREDARHHRRLGLPDPGGTRSGGQADEAKYGFKVDDTEGVSVTQSNISAEISNLVSHHPEGISLDLTLTQNATAATELAQAGFKGPIIAEDGAGNGTLRCGS